MCPHARPSWQMCPHCNGLNSIPPCPECGAMLVKSGDSMVCVNCVKEDGCGFCGVHPGDSVKTCPAKCACHADSGHDPNPEAT